MFDSLNGTFFNVGRSGGSNNANPVSSSQGPCSDHAGQHAPRTTLDDTRAPRDGLHTQTSAQGPKAWQFGCPRNVHLGWDRPSMLLISEFGGGRISTLG
jgi:hypothetical protein